MNRGLPDALTLLSLLAFLACAAASMRAWRATDEIASARRWRTPEGHARHRVIGLKNEQLAVSFSLSSD